MLSREKTRELQDKLHHYGNTTSPFWYAWLGWYSTNSHRTMSDCVDGVPVGDVLGSLERKAKGQSDFECWWRRWFTADEKKLALGLFILARRHVNTSLPLADRQQALRDFRKHAPRSSSQPLQEIARILIVDYKPEPRPSFMDAMRSALASAKQFLFGLQAEPAVAVSSPNATSHASVVVAPAASPVPVSSSVIPLPAEPTAVVTTSRTSAAVAPIASPVPVSDTAGITSRLVSLSAASPSPIDVRPDPAQFTQQFQAELDELRHRKEKITKNMARKVTKDTWNGLLPVQLHELKQKSRGLMIRYGYDKASHVCAPTIAHAQYLELISEYSAILALLTQVMEEQQIEVDDTPVNIFNDLARALDEIKESNREIARQIAELHAALDRLEERQLAIRRGLREEREMLERGLERGRKDIAQLHQEVSGQRQEMRANGEELAQLGAMVLALSSQVDGVAAARGLSSQPSASLEPRSESPKLR